MNILGDELNCYFPRIYGYEFYQEIFENHLEHQALDEEGSKSPGKYIAIATKISTLKSADKNGRLYRSHNFYVYDDLATIKTLTHEDKNLAADETDRLTIISPVSYAGSRRFSANARFLYALVIEIDNLDVTKDSNGKMRQSGLHELLHQIDRKMLPKPTFIVASGTGVHLYWQFVKPIPCFKNVKESLWRYKRQLTQKLWNRYVTTSYKEEEIQYESVFQGFRMVDTRTKTGDTCEAYRSGESVTIEYMNRWAEAENQIVVIYQNNGISLSQAKERWPDWYQKVVVDHNHNRRFWDVNPALYEWWKKEISNKAIVGHRYYCLLCLVAYAIKCNIPYQKLRDDAYSFLQPFEEMTVDEKNHFTIQDIDAALQAYRTRGETMNLFRIDSIIKYSGIQIKKNKRNGRKREDHLKLMNAIRSTRVMLGEPVQGGRPSAKGVIADWRIKHPDGKKSDCIKETGFNRSTVYKWWNKK